MVVGIYRVLCIAAKTMAVPQRVGPFHIGPYTSPLSLRADTANGLKRNLTKNNSQTCLFFCKHTYKNLRMLWTNYLPDERYAQFALVTQRNRIQPVEQAHKFTHIATAAGQDIRGHRRVHLHPAQVSSLNQDL